MTEYDIVKAIRAGKVAEDARLLSRELELCKQTLRERFSHLDKRQLNAIQADIKRLERALDCIQREH